MSTLRSVWAVALALGVLAVLTMVPGCGTDDDPAFKPASHPAQTTPAGHYAVTWTDLDVVGSGKIVVPGAGDFLLSQAELNALGTEIFGTRTDRPTGWHLGTCCSPHDATGLLVSPHPHNLVKFSLCFDEGSGCSRDQNLPGVCIAECPGLVSMLGSYVLSVTGEPAPIVLNVTKFQVADLDYQFHWTPDARMFGPVAHPFADFDARGVTIEATFRTDSGVGTFQATFDRFTANAVGTSVTACPECPTPRVPYPREQIAGS